MPSECIVLEDESSDSDPSSHEYVPKRRRLPIGGIWDMVHSSLRPLQHSPGIKELINCQQDKRFNLNFAKSINAGDILDHAAGVVVHHMENQVQRFKIGYTHMPHSRFYKVFEDCLKAFQGLMAF